MDALVDECLWSFLGASDGADYCKRRDVEDVVALETKLNLARQEAARRRFLFRACVVKPSRKVQNAARMNRVKQLGGAELEEAMSELDGVIDNLTELGDKPFREMLWLFAGVLLRVYSGRIKVLLDSVKIIGESSTFTPTLVKAYLGASLAELSSALEPIFDGVASFDLASLMIPFLVKAYLVKRKVFEGREAREQKQINKIGRTLLLAFRENCPSATQGMELEHMEEAASNLSAHA